jgi:GcrA cell cycle regulator
MSEENHPNTDTQLVRVNGNILRKVFGKFVENWTKDEIDQLVDLWSKGLTSREIGNVVGKSRNAVIGKAHRMQLPQRRPRNQYSDKIGSERHPIRVPSKATNNDSEMRKIAPPKFFAPTEPLTGTDPISIMKLGPRTCRSIVGKGADGLATYCGEVTYWNENTQRFNSYCGTHYDIYYDLNRRRRF